MLKSQRGESSSTADDLDQQLRQSFARMRSKVAARPDSGPAPAEPEDVIEPSLPAKLFIGPNATWYDDRWRWMDWRGQAISWNGAAAGSFGVWFGYRRMYGSLALALGWLGLLCILALTGVPLRLLLSVQALAMLGAGLYGNQIYLRHFRRIAREVAETRHTHAAQVQAITAAGGVDRRTPALAGAGVAALVLLVAIVMSTLGLGPTVRF